MAQFSYRATTAEGQIIEGVIESDTEASVVTSLRGQGYIPIRIDRGAAVGGRGLAAWSAQLREAVVSWRSRVGTHDLMLFTRELAVLLKAGLPLDRCLQSLATLAESDALKAIVRQVLLDVQEGKSLSDALAVHDRAFPSLYVNMVRAGEAGGVLEMILERLADYLEQSQKIRDEVRSAMVYPLFLVGVGGLMVVVMLTYVLPKFAVLFNDLGGSLPSSTQFVMAMSAALRAYWWGMALAALALFVSFRRWGQSEGGRLTLDRFKLRMPIFGELLTKIQVARFARTLGTMLQSGVPLIRSLEIVKAVVGNVVIGSALTSVQHDVSEGKGLAAPLERTGVFPSMALQMVGVGEETGRLDEMLLVVSDHYDRDVANSIRSLMSLIGPVVLVTIAGVVGFIIMAVMSAIFSVNELIQ